MQVLLFLAAGIVGGYLLRSRAALLTAAGRATMWSLYLLIFLLGVSMGVNEAAVGALGRLGVQALLLCAGGILGSVVAARVVFRRFFDRKCHEE